MYCAWAAIFLFCSGSSSFHAFGSAAARTITLTATDVDGINSGTVPLGYTSTIVPVITGSTNSSVIWRLNGAGWLSPAGVYWPPAEMPSNPNVTVTAALQNSTVRASYQFKLTNPAPSIRGASPGQLIPGTTNQVEVLGNHFVRGSTVLLNGKPVATTYKSSSALIINLPVAAVGAKPVSLQVSTPAPAGGSTAALTVPVAAESVSLTVSSSDGTTNSGTARVGGWMHIVPAVVAPYNQNITWTMQGAGTLAVGGWYHSPATMPSSPNVTVTVSLVANPAVYTSYKFAIVNAAPAINQTRPAQLPTDTTTQVTLIGSGFFPGTKLLLNGSPIPSTFLSSCCISVQVPVPDDAIAPVLIQAINPSPGGGQSAVFAAPIQLKRTTISAYNATGTNPAAVALGGEVQFLNSIIGPGDPTATWSVQGGGTISSTGLYHSPAAMGSSSTVTITSALVSNPAVTASYHLSLLNSVPMINGASPTHLMPGAQNTVTLEGSGFTPATTLLVGGHPLAVTYQSPTFISAQVTTANGQTGSVSLVAQNPSPGGGVGSPFQIPLASAAVASAQVALQPGRTIPLDFVGLSHEWVGLSWMFGTPSTQVNTIYRQLITNLMNGENYPFFIRIGGNSSDTAAEMSSQTADALNDLATAMDVKYSLGVNMAADSPQLAAQEANFYLSKLPAGSIATFELGNEPDNYGYSGNRPNPYSTTDFLSDYTNWSNAILPNLPKYTGFMGPAWANASNLQRHLASFETGQGDNVPIISQHIYGGYQEGGVKFAPDYLLTSTAAKQGPQLVASGVALAHQKGQLFRIGEINSIDGSGVAGISDAFGAALWAVDTMFEYANVGVDGVNWHGNVNNAYCAFGFGNTNVNGKDPYTLTKVAPIYYGMLFFRLAASNQAQLLPVAVQTNANIKVWATEDKSGAVHVIILNKDKSFSGNVSVSLPGRGAATVLQMLAPSYDSTDGITIGGQTFDGSVDGKPVGSPITDSIEPSNGTYVVPVQPTSAVLLTLSH